MANWLTDESEESISGLVHLRRIHRGSYSTFTIRVVLWYAFFAVLSIQGAAQVRNSSTSRKSPSWPLSPLYARLAFSYAQNIASMSSLSEEPLNELDFESSPFDIHQKALENEMERAKQFDLRTRGDRALHSMVDTALFLLSMHKGDLYAKDHDRYGGRWVDCIVSIRQAVSQRAYVGDGSCTLDKQ